MAQNNMQDVTNRDKYELKIWHLHDFNHQPYQHQINTEAEQGGLFS